MSPALRPNSFRLKRIQIKIKLVFSRESDRRMREVLSDRYLSPAFCRGIHQLSPDRIRQTIAVHSNPSPFLYSKLLRPAQIL